MKNGFVCLQKEAGRVALKIADLLAARAELDAHIESQKQLFASPELLEDHPELKWELVANQDVMPKLGKTVCQEQEIGRLQVC